LDNSKVPLDALGEEVPLIQVLPSNWCDPTSTEGFTHVVVHAASARNQASSGRKSFKGAGSYLGIVGGSASTSASSGTNSNFSEDLVVEFDLGVCRIVRPWLRPVLFNLGGWYIKGQPKKSISSGTQGQKKPANEVSWLPAIPVQMVVIKNLTIRGSSSTSIQQWAEQQKNGAGGGTLFGLTLGGKFSKASSSSSSSSAGAEGGFTIEGSTVVGWVSEVMPESPKMDGFEEVKP
jgi:hypothetical protein